MVNEVQIPQRGQGITAAWGASVAAAVNGQRVAGASGMLMRDGRVGQGFEPLPENRRVRYPFSNPPGCWALGSAKKSGEDENKTCFINRYYQIGGKLYQVAANVFIEDVFGDAAGSIETDGDEEAEVDLFVALEVSMDPSTFGNLEVKAYPSFEQMSLQSANTGKCVKPLYMMGAESYKIKMDLRNMPLLAAAEMPGETNVESGGSGSGGSGS